MKTGANFRLTGKSCDAYLELVSAFPLASIKTEEHLAEAQRIMNGLLRQGPLDSGAAMYFDALSDLVTVYEDAHSPIEPASDADMLRHLLEAKGITQAALSRDTRIPKSTISEALSGKKPFSRSMIRTLAAYFQVDVSVLTSNI